MRKKVVKNVFIFSSIVFIILSMSMSCNDSSFSLSTNKDLEIATSEGSGDNEINYPSMEYKSEVMLSGLYGGYSFTENVSVDVCSKKIEMISEYQNDFKVIEFHSDQATKDVRNSIESQKKISSEYTRSSTSKISGSEYSKISSLFVFVSKVKSGNKTVTFDKAVPFLPRDDVKGASFLNALEDSVNLSYVYKDDDKFKNGVSITINISAFESDNGDISIRLSNTISSMDTAHSADFWSMSVFPKTSTYYISKNGKIKTMNYDSQLIMSAHSRNESGYFVSENVSSQKTETKLCKYTIDGKTDSFDCK